jgi:hypothetical protein
VTSVPSFNAVKKPSRVARGIAAAIIVFAGLIVGLLWFLRSEWSDRVFFYGDFRTGNEIVSHIETFRTKHGRLPETLAEVGYEESESGPYYRKIDYAAYCVWFGTSLGESETYSSRTKKWEPTNNCP